MIRGLGKSAKKQNVLKSKNTLPIYKYQGRISPLRLYETVRIPTSRRTVFLFLRIVFQKTTYPAQGIL
jgi:hypothetical protein